MAGLGLGTPALPMRVAAWLLPLGSAIGPLRAEVPRSGYWYGGVAVLLLLCAADAATARAGRTGARAGDGR